MSAKKPSPITKKNVVKKANKPTKETPTPKVVKEKEKPKKEVVKAIVINDTKKVDLATEYGFTKENLAYIKANINDNWQDIADIVERPKKQVVKIAYELDYVKLSRNKGR